MASRLTDASSIKPRPGPDPSWRGLYLAGGVSAGLFVVLNLAALVMYGTQPPIPTAGGVATLEYVAAHRVAYLLQQELWLVPGLFAMVAYAALYPALKGVSKSVAALGALIGGAAWALTLAIPTTSLGAPALAYLSDQYAAAVDAAQRAAFATAAECLIAQNNTPTVAGVLTTVGMLIVSLAMLRGVFHKAVAILGIATGVLGIAAEALRYAAPSLYSVYGILLLAWTGAVAWKLVRLGSAGRSSPPA